MMKPLISRYLIFILAGAAVLPAQAAVDWSGATSRDITFFNAGTASWEGVLTRETHSGANSVRKHKSCLSCHEDEEAEMGEYISNDSKHQFYSPGTPSSLATVLQMAVDGERIYFRVRLPGVESGQVSLMLDDGAYDSSSLSGCWATCHADARNMPHDQGLSKYLSRSRSKNGRNGGGENYVPNDQLAHLLDNDEFLELMSVHFSPDIVTAKRGYVLEKSHLEKNDSLEAASSNGYISFSRPLTAAAKGQKSLSAGGSYTVSLSIHLGNAEGRKHLVSFPVNFRLGQNNDIRLIKNTQ